MSLKKTVKSALAIVPPPEIWDGFQRIRSVHDKAYKRWPPHINLMYPFLTDTGIVDVIPALMKELSQVAPFKVTFDSAGFGHFTHKKSATIWVCPSPAQKIISVEDRLLRAVPQCNDLAEFSDAGFAPHLTLGQASNATVEKTVAKFAGSWTPCSCTVDALYVLTREGDEPFTVAWVLPLGKGKQPIKNTDRGVDVDVLSFLKSTLFTEMRSILQPSQSSRKGKSEGSSSESESESEKEKEEEEEEEEEERGKKINDDDGDDDENENVVIVRKKIDPVREELKSKKKPRLRTSEEVFNRILWDRELVPGEFTVTYKDRFDGMIEVPFLEFPTEDVPFHRIWLFKKNGEVVWDRAGRTDKVFKKKKK